MGPLGIKIGQFIAERSGISTIAAVDKNPSLIGKNLSQLSEVLSPSVIINENVEDAIADVRPDVAILTTLSDMERVPAQVIEIVKL